MLQRMLSVYRQRWSIEDLFAWTKGALGWESVRLMSFEPLRILVAFAWLAAAFLHGLGADLADEGVQFLARLGGWQGGDSKPGPRTFAIGIAHLASYLTLPPMRLSSGATTL